MLYDVFSGGAHVGRVYSAAWELGEPVPVIAPGYCVLVMDLISDIGGKKVWKIRTAKSPSAS